MANENDKPEILIVDDEAGVRALLSDLFSERYTCLTAVSGDEALRLLTTHLPDLVISDINMEGMSGLELIPKVLAFSPNIVVMMISGSQTIDTAIESIRVGAFDFIRKPFELDEVEIAVERALDHHRLLVEKQRHEEQLEVLVAERTRQLNYVANYDALTGLPNRTLFEDRLAQAIVQADDGRGVAVLLLSSDRVKEVHDTLGHLISERILREFSDRLTTSLPLGSTVARFEADQFALLLPDIKSNLDITTVAEDVFRAIESSFLVEGHDIFLSVAIGISVFPDDGTDGQSLMKHAGVALSRARTSGSNTYQFFTGRMHAKALRRLTLQNDLRHALENNELKAYYQPKIDMNTGTIVGMEALIRWRHPQLGSLSPADFISIAEESRLIIEIGEWILREACTQTAVWRERDFDLQVAVNVSPVQFSTPLEESIRKILHETSCPPGRLNLEITESSIMGDAKLAIKTLNKLKRLGVKISIDDFGTGYSSLGHLKNMPIDVLKIDKSFINDVTTDPDDASLVMAIVNLAHNLNLSVVAEGVETEEQLRFLNLIRCEQWQGYLFSKPLPADEFTCLLEEKS